MMEDSSTVRVFFVSDQRERKRQRRCDKRRRSEEEEEEVGHAATTTTAAEEEEEEEATRSVLAQPLWVRTADCTLLQIQQKLAGYVRQDERKGRAAPEPPLTVAATLALLEAAAFRCTYCARDMPRVWSRPRDPAQWTLDRVDNARPHQIDNIVPSCMECNLRRRAQSHWAFRRGAALAAAMVREAEGGAGDVAGVESDGEDDEWVVARSE